MCECTNVRVFVSARVRSFVRLKHVFGLCASAGTIVNVNSGQCLDVVDFAGPGVDTWQCNGGVNQAFIWGADGTLATQVCVCVLVAGGESVNL